MHRCRDAQQVDLLLDGHSWQFATLREAVTTYSKLRAYRGAQWPDFSVTIRRLFAEAPEAEQAWFHRQEMGRLCTTLPPNDLAVLEATVQARRMAAGETPAFALDALVRRQTDAALAERIEMPAFDAWQRTGEEVK